MKVILQIAVFLLTVGLCYLIFTGIYNYFKEEDEIVLSYGAIDLDKINSTNIYDNVITLNTNNMEDVFVSEYGIELNNTNYFLIDDIDGDLVEFTVDENENEVISSEQQG